MSECPNCHSENIDSLPAGDYCGDYVCMSCHRFYRQGELIPSSADIQEDDNMKLNPKVTEKIEDGVHKGTITKVENRTTPKGYQYTDFSIKMEDSDTELRAGYPTSLTIDKDNKPKSGLAKQLVLLGIDVSKEVDTDTLIGKKVQFMTMTENTDSGEFARVVDLSVKPAG